MQHPIKTASRKQSPGSFSATGFGYLHWEEHFSLALYTFGMQEARQANFIRFPLNIVL